MEINIVIKTGNLYEEINKNINYILSKINKKIKQKKSYLLKYTQKNKFRYSVKKAYYLINLQSYR